MTGGGDDDGLGKPAYTARAALWEEAAGRCAVDCAEERELAKPYRLKRDRVPPVMRAAGQIQTGRSRYIVCERE